MAYGAEVGSTATYAAMINAVKASGAIVEVEDAVFEQIVNKTDDPLVVYAEPGFLSKKYSFLTTYKGLFFYTKTERQLNLKSCEMIRTKKIWIPN